MKSFQFSPRNSLSLLSSSSSTTTIVTHKHQILLCPFKLFSSSTNSIVKSTQWNSTTNVGITHPILLILESCNSMVQLKQIQAQMTLTALITHIFPLSRVLAFCALADNGDLKHAHLLFSHIGYPNTYMWNTMIRGCSKSDLPLLGLNFFRQMVHSQVELDTRSFVFTLKACEQISRVLEGESVHCAIWKLGFSSALLVQNGLIFFYGVHKCLVFARKLFDEMSVKDVFSWTSMIDCYSKHKCYNQALDLFNSMLLTDTEPNEVTMISVLSACSAKGDLNWGKSIHDYVKLKNLNISLNFRNAILDMYVKCGCLSAAREIFDNMRIKDVFSWTTMINGYAKSNELGVARILFNEMPEKNVVSWSAMIAGYSQNNRPAEALEVFRDMVESGFLPLENTLVCVLSACGQMGYLEMGKWIHKIEAKRLKTSVIIANALIDMYAKCGAIDAAVEVFNSMTKRDSISWNSMISAYATHGHSKQALVIFDEMIGLGFKPDDITFVGVLSACSHGGLIPEGRAYFKDMEKIFGITPKGEHYACMVDLLGRVGLVEEAYELINTMPMQPCKAAWGALLNGCKMHGYIELAKISAKKLIELDPGDSGTYVLLSATCAGGEKWGDVRRIRSVMRENRIKKIPGVSSVEIKGKFHEFSASSESHPQAEEIYKALDKLHLLSKMEDYDARNSCSVLL